MLRNFLKIAYRNLFKYKYYTIINILSFSIGITVFIFVALYTQNERSFDSLHSKSDRIYRIVNIYEKDNTINKYATNPFPLSQALLYEFPGIIEQSVRLFNFQNNFHLVEYHDKHFNEKNFFYTDQSIVEVFDFQFIIGVKDSSLLNANTLIISESIKKKYFGEFNPIGKSMLIDEGLPMVVTGVFKDFPEQSHFHPEILTPIASLYSFMKESENWLWNSCWTYVLLKGNINRSAIDKKLPQFVNKYFDAAVKDYTSINLQPIKDIHLNSNLESEIELNSNLLYVNTLMIVALFLSIVSLLNFINLSFVGSITRMREVSIRKILGSTRRSIVLQFIVESCLAVILAYLAALFWLEVFIPFFNYSNNQNLQISRLENNVIFFKMLLIVMVSGLVVGFYTGFYSSLFPTFNLGRFKQKVALRKWYAGKFLIMVQYIISLIILITVFVNFKQLLFFKNANLGFEKENILIIPIVNTPIADNYEEFKDKLVPIKGIISVSASDYVIGAERWYRRYFYEYKGVKKAQFFPELIVQYDFIKTLGIKILAGIDFNKGNSEPGKEDLIINESMAHQLANESTDKAIQKKLVTFKEDERIVGVIKDFSSKSLHNPVGPLVIRLGKENATDEMKYLIIKCKPDLSNKTIGQIEQLWKKYTSNRPFDYKFLGNVLNDQYKNEYLLNFLLWTFSFLILVISCMGIWAITSLLSVQRTKEIGIRKAIGASVPEILVLFVKDFTNVMIAANLVAWPIAWLILHQWFKNFANHIEISWIDFALASFVILLLTLAIVVKHAFKVASSNTIDSIRDE